MLSGANSFEISNIQEMKLRAHGPGNPNKMLHSISWENNNSPGGHSLHQIGKNLCNVGHSDLANYNVEFLKRMEPLGHY